MAYSPYKKSNAIQNHSSSKTEEAVQKFANMMIEKMTALKNQDWEKGWINGLGCGLPQNYTGRTYNASNSFMLDLLSVAEGYSMPVFMTFKQAVDNKLKINAGSNSFPVVYWDLIIKDENGNKLSKEDYNKLSLGDKLNCKTIPFLKYYNVFNIDQTNFKEVYPEKYETLKEKFKVPEIKDAIGMYTNNALDSLIEKQSWYCPIQTDKLSNKASYSPSKDVIVVPTKAQFNKHEAKEDIYRDGMEYYSTLLHEMAHSTKGKDRLQREGGKFGDRKYAKEELVAELTAALIGTTMGFDSKITDNSAKYLDNWISVLKEEPKFIISVMSDVNKAADMILDKIDEQRMAIGETPYLSKNMIAVDNGYSLEPEFKPVSELIASEPSNSYSKETASSQETPKEEKSSLMNQYDEMKQKHPDAILLFRVGDFYETFSEDAIRSSEILGLTPTRSAKNGGVDLCGFPHHALDTYLPKLVRAGARVAICEQLEPPKKFVKRGMSEENKKKHEELIKNQNKEDMAGKKKKSEETVAEKKEEQVKVEEPKQNVGNQESAITESKEEEKKEEAVKQTKEPQMITVNGDEVSHAHIYKPSKDSEENIFVAKINGNYLHPVPVSKELAEQYMTRLISVEEMMEKCYPTKLMQKVPREHFDFKTNNELVVGPKGEMKVEKFNVYKEKDQKREDYGKYKFYAQVGETKLSSVAKQEDLNAYFDRVQTPAQMVNKIFGEKLHLKSHYDQYKLPEGIKSDNITVFKGKEGKFVVKVEFEDKRKATHNITYDDRVSLQTDKTATKEQLAAKYLNDLLTKMLTNSQTQKLEKSNSLKP